jgi:hypothetical protein
LAHPLVSQVAGALYHAFPVNLFGNITGQCGFPRARRTVKEHGGQTRRQIILASHYLVGSMTFLHICGYHQQHITAGAAENAEHYRGIDRND